MVHSLIVLSLFSLLTGFPEGYLLYTHTVLYVYRVQGSGYTSIHAAFRNNITHY